MIKPEEIKKALLDYANRTKNYTFANFIVNAFDNNNYGTNSIPEKDRTIQKICYEVAKDVNADLDYDIVVGVYFSATKME